MKNQYSDFTFYEEFSNTRKTKSTGNVSAVFGDWFLSQNKQLKEAISGLFSFSNSPVASTAISKSYLTKYCKKVSVEKAKKIHPNLFKYLDKSN